MAGKEKSAVLGFLKDGVSYPVDFDGAAIKQIPTGATALIAWRAGSTRVTKHAASYGEIAEIKWPEMYSGMLKVKENIAAGERFDEKCELLPLRPLWE